MMEDDYGADVDIMSGSNSPTERCRERCRTASPDDSNSESLESKEALGQNFEKNINTVVLQYLKARGLETTSETFCNECSRKGYCIPDKVCVPTWTSESPISLVPSSLTNLVIESFEKSDVTALLSAWQQIINTLPKDEQHQLQKMTFFLNVYAAIVPYMNDSSSEGERLEGMEKLRKFFQTKSELTTDSEILSLFALPYVPDPANHPVFSKLFQPLWKKNLKSQLLTIIRTIAKPQKPKNISAGTDLGQMFLSCSKAISHKLRTHDGNLIRLLSNTFEVKFCSGVQLDSMKRDNFSDSFSPTQLFDHIEELVAKIETLTAETKKYEQKYAQLLSVAGILAESLQNITQGIPINMEKLQNDITEHFPSLLDSGKETSSSKECSPNRSGNDGAPLKRSEKFKQTEKKSSGRKSSARSKTVMTRSVGCENNNKNLKFLTKNSSESVQTLTGRSNCSVEQGQLNSNNARPTKFLRKNFRNAELTKELCNSDESQEIPEARSSIESIDTDFHRVVEKTKKTSRSRNSTSRSQPSAGSMKNNNVSPYKGNGNGNSEVKSCVASTMQECIDLTCNQWDKEQFQEGRIETQQSEYKNFPQRSRDGLNSTYVNDCTNPTDGYECFDIAKSSQENLKNESSKIMSPDENHNQIHCKAELCDNPNEDFVSVYPNQTAKRNVRTYRASSTRRCSGKRKFGHMSRKTNAERRASPEKNRNSAQNGSHSDNRQLSSDSGSSKGDQARIKTKSIVESSDSSRASPVLDEDDSHRVTTSRYEFRQSINLCKSAREKEDVNKSDRDSLLVSPENSPITLEHALSVPIPEQDYLCDLYLRNRKNNKSEEDLYLHGDGVDELQSKLPQPECNESTAPLSKCSDQRTPHSPRVSQLQEQSLPSKPDFEDLSDYEAAFESRPKLQRSPPPLASSTRK